VGDTPGRQDKSTIYDRFTAACRRGDEAEVRRYVTDDFTTNFPGRGWLSLDQVLVYFERLRGISHDFATLTPTIKQGALDDDVMYARYELDYHVGERRVTVTCVDEVVFEGDRIKSWYVFYDRVAAREQAGIDA
jgi:hypothetical protein